MLAPPATVDPGQWSVRCDGGLLVVDFDGPRQVASWAIWNGGRRRAPGVTWVAVKNAELPIGTDPRHLCQQRLQAAGLHDSVGLLTSGQLQRFRRGDASSTSNVVHARALATVGLSNAVRVGDSPGPLAAIGTINILCEVSAALTEEAALEALSIMAEARTAAVLEARYPSRRGTGIATGTGTDTLVLAWPDVAADPGAGRERAVAFAGKHTALGHVIGSAVGQCVRAGVADWMEANGCRGD